MPHLTQQQIKQLGDELSRIQGTLEEQLRISKESSNIVQLDQTTIGRVSRIDAIQQQKMLQSTRQSARTRLIRINRALTFLAQGEYGYCQNCDTTIGLPRLQALPESTLCLNCQQLTDSKQDF